jgi:hypothetical protein
MTTRAANPWLAHAGSLRATLAAMALFALVVLGGALTDGPWTAAIAGAIALLSANLLAAIVLHPAFWCCWPRSGGCCRSTAASS